MVTFSCKSQLQEISQLDLSGVWQFRFDPSSIGESGNWFNPEFNNEWDEIKVPGSYSAAFPDSM